MLKKLHILVCVALLTGISWTSRSPAQESKENVLSEIALSSLQSGEEELYYDDGEQGQTLLTKDEDSAVFAVCFTPSSYPCTLKKVKYNLSWVLNDYSFKVHVYQQENDSSPPGPELIESFTAQSSETGWYTHDISDFNVTIQSGNFAIGIEISDDFFFLYTDEDPPIANRSWYSTSPEAGEPSWELNESYNFMIRATVEYAQPATTTTTTTTTGPGTTTTTTGQGTTTTTTGQGTTTTTTGQGTTTTTTGPGTTTTTTGPSTTTTTKECCPSKEIYGEGSEETELLRYLRDNLLSRTPEGRKLIKMYYQLSPTIVKIMEEDEEFKEEVKELIDGVLLLMEDQDK